MNLRAFLLCLVSLLPMGCSEAYAYGPYSADLVRVIDGDTVEVDVAVWPGLVQRISLRLAGVNTPEKRGVSACEKRAAQAASAFTAEFLQQRGSLTVDEVRLGKYAGRALGRIYVGPYDLAAALVSAGHAIPYDGGRRGPWCRASNEGEP